MKNVLAKPNSQICNLFIKYSIFLPDCKIAKSKTLLKKGSKTAPKNHLPISLLPLVSKVIEKVIHDQTQRFLGKNDIFADTVILFYWFMFILLKQENRQ